MLAQTALVDLLRDIDAAAAGSHPQDVISNSSDGLPMAYINAGPFTTRPEINGTFGVVASTHWNLWEACRPSPSSSSEESDLPCARPVAAPCSGLLWAAAPPPPMLGPPVARSPLTRALRLDPLTCRGRAR